MVIASLAGQQLLLGDMVGHLATGSERAQITPDRREDQRPGPEQTGRVGPVWVSNCRQRPGTAVPTFDYRERSPGDGVRSGSRDLRSAGRFCSRTQAAICLFKSSWVSAWNSFFSPLVGWTTTSNHREFSTSRTASSCLRRLCCQPAQSRLRKRWLPTHPDSRAGHPAKSVSHLWAELGTSYVWVDPSRVLRLGLTLIPLVGSPTALSCCGSCCSSPRTVGDRLAWPLWSTSPSR